MFDFPSGIENSNKAITLNPNSAFAHNILGSILADNGDLHNAIIETKKAITINKNYAEAYVNISKLYDQEGNTEESILSAKQAKKTSENNFYAVSSFCPHFGGPLAFTGKDIRCYWHGWRFNLISYKCSNRQVNCKLKNYKVIKKGKILEIYNGN